jgi:hypothetical protein
MIISLNLGSSFHYSYQGLHDITFVVERVGSARAFARSPPTHLKKSFSPQLELPFAHSENAMGLPELKLIVFVKKSIV